jgi:hypothetical protein
LTCILRQDMGLEHARQYGWQDTYVFTKAMGEMLVGEVAKVRGVPRRCRGDTQEDYCAMD